MENKIKLDSAYFVLLIAKEIICCHIPLKGSNMRFKTGCLPFKCMGVLWEVCYLKETTKICHFSKKIEIPIKFCPLFIIILLETSKMHILNVLYQSECDFLDISPTNTPLYARGGNLDKNWSNSEFCLYVRGVYFVPRDNIIM